MALCSDNIYSLIIFFLKKKTKQTFINLFKKYEGQAIWLIDQEVSTQEQNRFE